MKKLIRVMGLCALVALAFSSCKKNETKTFSATAASIERDSKTHINDGLLVWNVGDEVTFVNPTGTYKNFFVSEVKDYGTTATFHVYDSDGEFMDSIDVPCYYRACYPFATVSGDEVRVPVAARQTFCGESFATNTFPMHGWNENGAFRFKTNAGLLYIPFKRADGATDEQATLDSLVIVAKGSEMLTGEMVYHYADTTHYSFNGLGNSVTLVCNPPAVMSGEIGASTTFSFVLPEGVFSNGFDLYGYHGGVQVFHREAAAPAGNFSCIIEARKIRKMLTCTIPQ